MSFFQKSRAAIILASFMVMASSTALGFNEYKKYADQLWEFEANSSLYQTKNNYLRSGNTFDSLPNGGSYQLTNIDLGVRWNSFKNWAFYTETRMGAAESKDATLTRTTSQFNQVLLGTDFLMIDGPFKLIPDLQFVMPLVRVDKTTANTMTSEGAMEVLARVIARFDIKSLMNQVFVGMTYRDEGRSTLLNYGAGTELGFGNSFLGAEIRGFSTIINDQYTSLPTDREAPALRVNGGSTKFNSINPSLLDSNYWYRWDNKKWGLQLGGGFSITGASTAAGTQFFANFIYRLQGPDWTRSAPVVPPTPVPETPIFKEETNDGVDQILFQPPAPPKVAPKPTPKPSPQTQSGKKKVNIQEELNKTEMQIELKSLKKKKKGPTSP